MACGYAAGQRAQDTQVHGGYQHFQVSPPVAWKCERKKWNLQPEANSREVSVFPGWVGRDDGWADRLWATGSGPGAAALSVACRGAAAFVDADSAEGADEEEEEEEEEGAYGANGADVAGEADIADDPAGNPDGVGANSLA